MSSMSNSAWFDDLPVLGAMSPGQAVAKLREMGDLETALQLESAPETIVRGGSQRGWWPFEDKPWQHTAHTFGYLAPHVPGNDALPIQHAANIAADTTLKNTRVKVTLDRLRVAAYPGLGIHRVLFDFYARNQTPDGTEDLHFNAVFRVRNGQEAGITGFPIFVGLNVGSEGLTFKCFTINVKNEHDDAFLSFLDSDVFQAGLQLTSNLQPAIALLSGMTVALTRAVAKRRQNVPVQDFYMGLDFSTVSARARLAVGSYFVVQIPQALRSQWDWSEWVYDLANAQVVKRADKGQLIPYNYIVFSISRY